MILDLRLKRSRETELGLSHVAVFRYPAACCGVVYYSRVKERPIDWRSQALIPSGQQFGLREEYHARTFFLVEDVRTIMPEGDFRLILCRNLVFTCFDEAAERKILEQLTINWSPVGR